jgi:hypothetical protein
VQKGLFLTTTQVSYQKIMCFFCNKCDKVEFLLSPYRQYHKQKHHKTKKTSASTSSSTGLNQKMKTMACEMASIMSFMDELERNKSTGETSEVTPTPTPAIEPGQ